MSEVYTNVNEQLKNIDIIEQLSKSPVISKCNFNNLADYANGLTSKKSESLKSESCQLKKNGIITYVTEKLLSDHDTLISYLLSQLNSFNPYIEYLIFTGNLNDCGYRGILTEKIKNKFKIFLTKKSIWKISYDLKDNNKSEFYVSNKTYYKLIKRGLIIDGTLHGRKINVVDMFGNKRLIVLADLTQYNIFLNSKNFDCRFSDLEGAYRFTFRSFGFMRDCSQVRVLKYWF